MISRVSWCFAIYVACPGDSVGAFQLLATAYCSVLSAFQLLQEGLVLLYCSLHLWCLVLVQEENLTCIIVLVGLFGVHACR